MADTAGLALVTGASGFVGSHLVEHLVARGQRVRCVLRAGSSAQWIPAESAEVFRVAPGDDTGLEAATRDVQVVYHLAAVTSASSRAAYRSVNVDGTRQLLHAVQRSAPEALFVLCSSQAAGGPALLGRPVVETDESRPIGPYGESKLEAERTVRDSGVRHVIVRPPTVYGPRERDIFEMFRFAAMGLAPLVGPRHQKLSIVHVRDLCEGLMAAADRGTDAATYYLTDGNVHTRSELVTAIAAAVGRRAMTLRIPVFAARGAAQLSRVITARTGSKPLLTPERVTDMCQLDWTCDDTRARNELGYSSGISIQDGMRQTAAWYKEHKWL